MSHNLTIPSGYTWGSGEYIELDYVTHNAILIEDENFAEMTTIIAKAGPVQITGTIGAGNDYTGTGIKVVNSSNIRFIGFSAQDLLYGFETINSSNIEFYNFRGENVGQHVGAFRSTIGNTCGGLKLYNSHLIGGGKEIAQFGELIYIGDGQNPESGIITDVEVVGNYFRDSGNEAVDIKTNCRQAKVFNNYFDDIKLKFNGAITVATEDSVKLGERQYFIAGNVFNNITNTNDFSINCIALGCGDSYVWNNTFLADEHEGVYAVRGYSTFNNSTSNRIFLGGNDWRSLPAAYHYAETDAGLNTTRSPIVLNMDPSLYPIPV